MSQREWVDAQTVGLSGESTRLGDTRLCKRPEQHRLEATNLAMANEPLVLPGRRQCMPAIGRVELANSPGPLALALMHWMFRLVGVSAVRFGFWRPAANGFAASTLSTLQVHFSLGSPTGSFSRLSNAGRACKDCLGSKNADDPCHSSFKEYSTDWHRSASTSGHGFLARASQWLLMFSYARRTLAPMVSTRACDFHLSEESQLATSGPSV